ncbi:MAG: flagellar assembly protein FliH [Micrococcales bacterium]|nr:flagellar assembly protein FliH [Micrococcales bacterium]
MSLSSDTFVPLAATQVDVPRQRSGAVRSVFGASVAEAAVAVAAAAEVEALPARFVPLVEDSQSATLAVREQARATGFAAGFAAGSREAARVAVAEAEATRQRVTEAEAARAAEHAQAMEALAAATRAVRASQVPTFDAVEQRLHVAALELAAAVIGSELSDAERSAQAALARVLTTGTAGELVVRMNPRDADAVGGTPEGMRVIVDPSLAHGDAVAEHADGEIDARISTALARARAALAETNENEA